jgi:hypothetical protein
VTDIIWEEKNLRSHEEREEGYSSEIKKFPWTYKKNDLIIL